MMVQQQQHQWHNKNNATTLSMTMSPAWRNDGWPAPTTTATKTVPVTTAQHQKPMA